MRIDVYAIIFNVYSTYSTNFDYYSSTWYWLFYLFFLSVLVLSGGTIVNNAFNLRSILWRLIRTIDRKSCQPYEKIISIKLWLKSLTFPGINIDGDLQNRAVLGFHRGTNVQYGIVCWVTTKRICIERTPWYSICTLRRVHPSYRREAGRINGGSSSRTSRPSIRFCTATRDCPTTMVCSTGPCLTG